jgi:hypothetical protein
MTYGSSPGVVVNAVATESYLMSYGGEWCNALISAPQSQTSFPFAALIGAPGLKSSVIIFDRAKKQIGFAPHAACKTSARPVEPNLATPAVMPRPRIHIPNVSK